MTRRPLIALTVMLLVLAGCGDDDDSTVAAAPDAPTSTTPTTNASGGDGSPCDEPEPGCPGNLDTAVAEFRDTPEACGGEAGDLSEGIAPVDTLTEVDGGDLVIVTCEVFAYQATYDIRLWDGNELQAVQVQQWVDGAVEDDSVVLGNPVMDGENLVNLEKARGIGDCGVYSEWTVSATEVVLLKVSSKECDDTQVNEADADPATWPVVYQAD